MFRKAQKDGPTYPYLFHMFRCHSPSLEIAPSLQCQVCRRTYDRLDHLNRHLDSRTYSFDIDPLIQRMPQRGK
ncbi:C2H2 type zinc finger domain containing protein [Pyrenophora tritici-repentis Pt-1C-BFP]|uniref:C2H2 type zinc finger domain containing protein n=1 Tax=Pyrenophora tritici-repentis (strain Pt-1C-BFP) TaxID=426418 RepID=B2WNT7_PYRTR|nr:C2H2 type zinc finger domain containing protein [Pyrenophora tritici-repentis Pt-1C-BFP]EDU44697.1 C2H2 type zinc finger domain containing protein [Pyrenophora tritici-repentis Pt-1C-BFP]